jgi:anhydro-N-acetylmuramic acid kinase
VRYLGLMSGTSADGIDAALIHLDSAGMALEATLSHPLPGRLARQIRAIARHPAGGTLDGALTLDLQLGRCFARTALTLIRQAGHTPQHIRAIGLHGQTLRHRPEHRHPYSLQMGNAQCVALETGITTLADWRMRDILLGGQGAPLVPLFHAELFGSPDEPRAILNLGGIANLTLVDRAATVVGGFDCGPANCLMDAWTHIHLETTYDADGQWARCGQVIPHLLARFLDDPFFLCPPPKSTGLDHFNPQWLRERLAGTSPQPAPQDVQRTLCELTVETIAQALAQNHFKAQRLLVCGGGARNGFLLQRLKDRMAPIPVESTAEHGLDPQWVEAAAFAWLAHRSLEGKAGNVPAATGARRATVLGGIFPAG